MTHPKHAPNGRPRLIDPVRSGRALYLVDLENLIGGATCSAEEVLRTWTVLDRGLGLRERDHVVVATSHRLARTAWFVLPTARVQLRARSGRNGADLALLDYFDVRHAASHFEWLVIASGDGIFTSTAHDAREHGLRVHQVTGRGGCHRDLRAACSRHSRLRLDRAA